MPTEQKVATIAEIRDKFAGAGGVILVDYRGLTVKEMQGMRAKLREVGAEVRVYKNTLTARALIELEYPSMDEMLEGPTAFVFAGDEPVAPSKAIFDYAKEHKALEVKGGLFEGHVVAAADVKRLASLPSREILIAQIMGALQSPVRNFMYLCNAPAGALARAFRAVADQKAAA